jgi:Pentapeptide repeats (8 copies)
MIEIKRWYMAVAYTVAYTSRDATSIAQALVEAVRAGVILSDANLRGANLRGANLYGADLRGADLSGADLSGAVLSSAVLSGADLSGAVLRDANLGDAILRFVDLRGAVLRDADLGEAVLRGADLRDADLSGADLSYADLRNTNLSDANLSAIRDDVWAILDAAPAEVPALLTALQVGRFNGLVYEGDCACLVGTIAKARGCQYGSIPGLAPDTNRPAERWASAIRRGNTSQDNPVAAITAAWIKAWLAKRAQAPEMEQVVAMELGKEE